MVVLRVSAELLGEDAYLKRLTNGWLTWFVLESTPA
jgi:hypothetical protein